MRDDRPEDFQTVYTREGARSVRVGNFIDWTPYHVRVLRRKGYTRAVALALARARLAGPDWGVGHTHPALRINELARFTHWARLTRLAGAAPHA